MVGREESFFCFAMQKQFVINVVIRPFRRRIQHFSKYGSWRLAPAFSDCSLRISDARFDFDCQIFLSPTLRRCGPRVVARSEAHRTMDDSPHLVLTASSTRRREMQFPQPTD